MKQDAIDRLIAEETELNEKRSKLDKFIETDGFKNINPIQQALLKIQSNAMSTYSECLNQRLIQISNEVGNPETSI